MGLVYITGISGTGKSEVCKQLHDLGYWAFGTDEEGISAWYDANGCLVDTPARDLWRTQEWQATHRWCYSRERLESLATRAVDTTIFVCGSAANENEVWPLFSKVIYLFLNNEEELQRRLSERSDDGFGKEPHELAAILSWNKTNKSDYMRFGATLIDANQSIEKVVKDLIHASDVKQ
jgi:shikimate kinase